MNKVVAKKVDLNNEGDFIKREELNGGVILSKGFSISEEEKINMAVFQPANKEKVDGKIELFLLVTKNGFLSPILAQIKKELNSKNKMYSYSVKKIQPELLQELYLDKAYIDGQGASIETGGRNVVIFNDMISRALRENSSDIHIEVRPEGTTTRMRIDGDLIKLNDSYYRGMSKKTGQDIVSVMYNVLLKNGSTQFNAKDFQEGAIDWTVPGSGINVRLRYQSIPLGNDDFDIIMRVLRLGRSSQLVTMKNLGMEMYHQKVIEKAAARPFGSLIIAGITGSGKSTSLKNVLMGMNARTGFAQKFYTIENPPEYVIPYVTQIPVPPAKEEDIGTDREATLFEKPIKACMRADPDVIMIGEIRDKLTADLMKKAVQSGHQVLGTTHTTSSLGIISRLEGFGLNKEDLCAPSFLTALLYQSLIKLNCQHCKVDFHSLIKSGKASEEDKEVYADIEEILGNRNIEDYPIFVENKDGCKECQFRGFKGRSVCVEVVEVDEELLENLEKLSAIDLQKYWRGLSDRDPSSENMRGKTVMEHAFLKMLQGIVSPYNVIEGFMPLKEMLPASQRNNTSVKAVANANADDAKSVLNTARGSENTWKPLD